MNYSSGHPWYYKLGGKILSVDEIKPRKVTEDDFKLWRKSYKTNIDMLNSLKERLFEDTERYTNLVTNGIKALSQYDINIACGGNAEMALFTALTLKHNHISHSKGYIQFLQDKEKATFQTSLF